ncbi:flavin reductase family protein [Halococcoides cellulosivorans]|uniref:Flavin reductase n=1 Tax=Halococcoides cellulosivorans TaxID=1679096 RepID=A0A2R4X0Q6_9EURY|nr:flavin reductase family protein [Halococcoides cellulosivorans]AWB27382.1 flavin reductase [Halococcoides cellulosivorans]
MEWDAQDLDGFETFLTLGRVVTPRPIGWISTTGPAGDNVAPYSFVTPIAVDPPVIVFQAAPHRDGSQKDTARNVAATESFVYNLVTKELMEAMNDTARQVDDEFATAGIDPAESVAVEAPRVAQAPAAIECSLRETVDIEGTAVIFGAVERVAVEDSYVADGLPDAEAIADDVVGHVIDDVYATLDTFRKAQPE